MEVTLIAANSYMPLDFIGSIAGICYGKDDSSKKRAIRCFKNGHMSVFEHLVFTWRINDISRACSHQLVRHRIASYTQQSQRYTKTTGDDWYVIPPEIKGEGKKLFYDELDWAVNSYETLLKMGIKPEDARFALPEATKTSLFVTMNAREFIHFYELRSSKHAQWEIRELAGKMINEIRLCNGLMKDFAEMIEEGIHGNN